MSSKTYLSVAETAKLVRAALKTAFPGVKFSVRSHGYAGGASIDVRWTDGPHEADVSAVVKAYEGASFDPMIDLKSYHDAMIWRDGAAMPEVVSFGADYVFTHRDLSPEYAAALEALAAKVIDRSADHYRQGFGMSTFYHGVPTRWGVMGAGTGYTLIGFLSQHVSPAEVAAVTATYDGQD